MGNPSILYDNIFTLATPTATTTDSGDEFDAAHLNDYRTYTYWKASKSSTCYLYIDAGASDTADTLGIVSHNLGTVGATVSVESSATGAWGGVYFCGGVLDSWQELVLEDILLSSFRRHGQMSSLLEQVPVWRIVLQDPALKGLAAVKL